jgi:hypothetical protein
MFSRISAALVGLWILFPSYNSLDSLNLETGPSWWGETLDIECLFLHIIHDSWSSYRGTHKKIKTKNCTTKSIIIGLVIYTPFDLSRFITNQPSKQPQYIPSLQLKLAKISKLEKRKEKNTKERTLAKQF